MIIIEPLTVFATPAPRVSTSRSLILFTHILEQAPLSILRLRVYSYHSSQIFDQHTQRRVKINILLYRKPSLYHPISTIHQFKGIITFGEIVMPTGFLRLLSYNSLNDP